jgi:uncharacterized protein YecE (DUF72 family)
MAVMAGTVKLGISAWTEPTLIAAGWYPPGVRSAEARLRHYASRFPLVEVDSPYYAVPARRQAEAWVERTPADFTMNVKAYALFTGHYTDPGRLPRDLLRALPAALRGKSRLYPRDVPSEVRDELARRFREGLEPLRASGKLGVLLLQYPVWFPRARATREQLLETRRLFPDFRLAVEFRNATWMSERNRRETLAFLEREGLLYTCVDEPQGFPSSVPPLAEATGALAVVRFHGRNAKTWNRPMPSAATRLDYRYRPDELAEWVPRIQSLAARTREVHVVMNNCHHDYAVANAAELAGLLAAARVGDVRPQVAPRPERDRAAAGVTLA